MPRLAACSLCWEASSWPYYLAGSAKSLQPMANRPLLPARQKMIRSLMVVSAVAVAAFFAPIETAVAQPADDFNQPSFPARPAPAWLQPFDQKESDPKLAGI